MQLCRHCDNLLGQPAIAVPHRSLRTIARLTRSYGVIEDFACARCGVHMQRFLATHTWRNVRHCWEIRSPLWAGMV